MLDCKNSKNVRGSIYTHKGGGEGSPLQLRMDSPWRGLQGWAYTVYTFYIILLFIFN